MGDSDLIYHETSPTLYPTNVDGHSLLTVKFAESVRVQSLRITPEGVHCPGGAGTTFPAQWTGKLFLNVSPSDPVNALAHSEISYAGGDWPVEYDIDMPEGVTTRLLSIFTPATSLTMSVYGNTPNSAVAVTTRVGASESTDVVELQMDDISTVRGLEEHPSPDGDDWISNWAGGPEGLIRIIASSDGLSDAHVDKAVACLSLLSLTIVRPILLQHPGAIPQLVRWYPPCWNRIIELPPKSPRNVIDAETWSFFFDPSVAPHVPPEHALYPLCATMPDERLGVAWRFLDRPCIIEYLGKQHVSGADVLGDPLQAPPPVSPALIAILQSLGPGSMERGSQTKLSLLVQAAEHHAGELANLRHLAFALDLCTIASLRVQSTKGAHGRQAQLYLARKLPGLLLSYNVAVDILAESDPKAADTIGRVKVLDGKWLEHIADNGKAMQEIRGQLELLRGVVIHGRLAEPYVRTLIASLPARYSPVSSISNVASPPAEIVTSNANSTPESRAQLRLLNHLSTPFKPSGLVHTLTAGDLVRLLAPDLHATLASARVPLLGIQPSEVHAAKGGKASDFAGKVYGGHEFRNRGQVQGSGQSGQGGVTPGARVKEGAGSAGGIGGSGEASAMGANAAGHATGLTNAFDATTSTTAPNDLFATFPGASAPSTNLLVPGHTAIMSPNMLDPSTGGGIGAGALGASGRISRPASRHVDDYAG